MMDQATTLRYMAALKPHISADTQDQNFGRTDSGASASADAPAIRRPRHARTLAITSGKGGVGKSNFAVNVALELAALNQRVSLLDADLALANADVLFGLNPQYHLGHVLSGRQSLMDIVIDVAPGVRLIPGGSGVSELAELSREQHQSLIDKLCLLEEESDFLLVDTAAGIASNVTSILRVADEAIIVTTPDPTAVVDAYATIKVLHQHAPDTPIWIVVNNVVGVGDAERVFAQLHTTSDRFLGHPIALLGTIPRDPALVEAVREQTPVVRFAPENPASRALRLIARYLAQSRHPRTPAKPRESFWLALS
jgi:flagellar biosynthesis protein FlhG